MRCDVLRPDHQATLKYEQRDLSKYCIDSIQQFMLHSNALSFNSHSRILSRWLPCNVKSQQRHCLKQLGTHSITTFTATAVGPFVRP
jgi:hypothetical protein